MRVIEDGEIFRLHRDGNGSDRRRILRADVASAAIAVAVKRAARPALVFLRIDGRWRTVRMPSQLLGDIGHVIGKPAPAQRWHWIFTLARRFENVSRGIDLAPEVACLARNAHLML